MTHNYIETICQSIAKCMELHVATTPSAYLIRVPNHSIALCGGKEALHSVLRDAFSVAVLHVDPDPIVEWEVTNTVPELHAYVACIDECWCIYIYDQSVEVRRTADKQVEDADENPKPP